MTEPFTKTILCLANSRKLSGRCVAGKEYLSGRPGPWIRPVSQRPNEEVSEYERQYQDGSDPRVLDILLVPLKGRANSANAFQTENMLIDENFYWTRVGTLDLKSLTAWTDDPPELWLNGDSTYNGRNDRVSVTEAANLTNSLYLLRCPSFEARVFAPGAAFGNAKRRVQIHFSHRGSEYWLWSTDPVVERELLNRPDGATDLGGGFATISLGEPFNGYCYKLVATLFTERTMEWRQA